MPILSKGMNASRTRGLAYVNHGRWLVDCPVCGAAIRIDPAAGNQTICPMENPGLLANKFVRRVEEGEESFVQVPDERKREETRRSAQPFSFILPDDWHTIFETLRPRQVANMNWLPGETVADLIAENIEHGVQKLEP